MMTCKDCLHYEVCESISKRESLATLYCAEECPCFTDKSEWVHPADVMDVIHGKWEYVGNLANSIVYKCSVCGRCVSSTYPLQLEIEPSYPYCHCGAKMDGKE